MSDEAVKISESGTMDMENAARYLGTSISAMRWYRRLGRLPFFRCGRFLRIKQSDLDAFVDTRASEAACQ